ncbi:sugar transferase [Halomonas sp. LBP4]|uniref:sugar transferase n=1 Tax=Halomonas sp. LBP4 TaxID=2044917 RepID=UPI000D772BF9|nr:sugar transferase [Halomonas sp. LBP4]PXX97520.1 sugar transferase [Halomonas sp. LBP4]
MNLSRRSSHLLKRTFDFLVSTLGLALTWWIIAIAWVAATLDTGRNGFYMQRRIGIGGQPFTLVKIRTMRDTPSISTTVTQADDPRITPLGQLLRRTKIDELPQLWNVLIGDMSLVGPRPDVEGFADALEGEQRLLLTVRPGITGPATLKYRHEEELLRQQQDPESYNRNVIWPDKVSINLHYMRHWSFRKDMKYLWRTLLNG